MVVWVFAGGGATEVRGLMPFLEKHVACTFERKMPVSRKPGPKPRKHPPTQGYTGKSFRLQLKKQLQAAFARQESCDLILVIDDLDCRNPETEQEAIETVINQISETTKLSKIIGFAAPEIEAWLLADWHQAVHQDRQLRLTLGWLSSKKDILPFDNPETFSQYDPNKDSCQQKLSAEIEQLMLVDKINFSKAIDTPRLLLQIRPHIVSKKCPLFRKFFTALANTIQHNS